MSASRILLTPFLLSMLLLAPAASGQGSDDIFRSESHGFSIERPGEGWVFKETRDKSAGKFTLAILHEENQGLVQVTVRVDRAGAFSDPAALRKATLDSIAGKAEYSKRKKKTFTVAGRKAPGFIIDLSAGRVFRVRQCYLIEKGFRYTVGCHAPREDFSSFEKAFGRAWKSFLFTPLGAAAEEERKISDLAARCGSEVDWAAGWEDAAKRARKEKKLILLRVRFLLGFQISDSAFSGPLMDPDVLGIVKERFVPLRFARGMDVPFVSQDSYGMGPSTFGSAFLAITPDGDVVADTFTSETAAVHAFLLETLVARPAFSGPSRPAGIAALDLAAWCLRRGDYAGAAALLESPRTVRGHLLKASLLRRLRKGREALAAIEAARAAQGASEAGTGAGTDGAFSEADLMADEALILLRLGETARSAAILEKIVADHAASDRFPEALYRLGACRLVTGGSSEAAETWKKLIAAHGENRWAWKAAASLSSTAFSLGYGERLDWPPGEILDMLRDFAFEPLKPKEARRAEEEAAAYLLGAQRPDGSWINPTEVSLSTTGEPNVFTVAITAICAHALLPRRAEPGVAPAVVRAVDFLLGEREKEKVSGEKIFFMDYTVWSKSFLLWLFVDCVDAGLVERERLAPVMNELVGELAAKQKKGGGWSYYLSQSLAEANNPANLSTSFVTAAVLIALLEARDGGVDVPGAMTDSAVNCLEKMANPDGSFEYFLYHDNEKAPRATAPAGSAGRAPLCALALFRADRGDRAGLLRGLDLFVKHRASYAKEHGKALMHAGPEGQGVHYLMFDYAFAARAVSRLPGKDQARYRRILLEQILGARGADGGYLDFPMMGAHYGTAMALQAFRLLH
jgi:hypothetical protein